MADLATLSTRRDTQRKLTSNRSSILPDRRDTRTPELVVRADMRTAARGDGGAEDLKRTLEGFMQSASAAYNAQTLNARERYEAEAAEGVIAAVSGETLPEEASTPFAEAFHRVQAESRFNAFSTQMKAEVDAAIDDGADPTEVHALVTDRFQGFIKDFSDQTPNRSALSATAGRIRTLASELETATAARISVLGDLAGAGVRSLRDRLLKQPEHLAAPELEAGDAVMAPALTTLDIEPTPPRRDIASEGITVEMPDGQVVDVPAEPRRSPAATLESMEAPAGTNPAERAAGAPTGLPESPEGIPAGDGAAGWKDVDWGRRKSPERAEAAARHVDGLAKWIKQDEVAAFMKAVDEGFPEGGAGRINERWVDWDALGDPKEVLAFTNAIADIFRGAYDAAGDARQGWEATAQAVRQMDMTLSDIIKVHADITGEGGIAARTGALRDAALASDKAFYDQLVGIRAAMEKGDKSGLPSLVEALNRTVVLGAMDAGASSEIARALQYRQRKPDFAQSDLQAAVNEIGRLLNNGGELDDKALTGVLDTLTDAYAKGGSRDLRQAIGKMREMGFWDYTGYYMTANLLSAPTTHIRNLLGTPIHALFQVGERYVAAGIGAARTAAGLGSAERVTFREALAYSTSFSQAWGEAMSLAGQAWKRGAPVSDARSSVMADAATANVPFAFSGDRWEAWKRDPLSFKTAGDALGVAVFEAVRTLGFRPSVAADEFYKAFGRRMQLNALSYREAAYRAALVDPEEADGVFAKTLEALQQEPSAAAFREARAFFAGDRAGAKGVHEPGSREEEMALMGRPLIRPEGQRGALQAFNVSSPSSDPLERELASLAGSLLEGFRIGATPRKMNGGDLTPEEYGRLVEVQGQLYRDRRSGLNMEETLRELVASPDYGAAIPEARAFQVKKVVERFRERANQAVRDPSSPWFMEEAARRTGAVKLNLEGARRGWSADQAARRASGYGLDPAGPEMDALRDTLDFERNLEGSEVEDLREALSF